MPNLNALYTRCLTALSSYRWQMTALIWTLSIVGWIAIAFVPETYKSTARIHLDTGAILTPVLRGLAVDSSVSSDLDFLQKTLLSRPNLRKLVARTPLNARAETNEDRDELARNLGTRIKVGVPGHSLFSLEYSDASPAVAHDVVQATVDLLVETATATLGDDMATASTFVDRQIASYEQKLQVAEHNRAGFQMRFADVLRTSGPSRLDSARDQLHELEGSLADAVARRDLLAREMAHLPILPSREGDRIENGPRAALSSAEAALAAARVRFTEAHPDVVAARALVDTLKSAAKTNLQTDVQSGSRGSQPAGPAYSELLIRSIDTANTISALQRKLGVAQIDVSRLAELVEKTPGVQAEYANLNRDYDVLRHNYDELLTRRELMRIGAAADEQADKVKLRIVDPPDLPTKASSVPRYALNAAVPIVAGLAALALCFLVAQTDSAFYSMTEIAALGVSVAGVLTMPEVKPALWRRLGPVGLTGILLLVALPTIERHPHWLTAVAGLFPATAPGKSLS